MAPFPFRSRHAPIEDAPRVTRDVLVEGILVANYVTHQPAVTQWTAVADVTLSTPTGAATAAAAAPPVSCTLPRWFVVGTGRTEQEAIDNLRKRLREAQAPVLAGDVAQSERPSYRRGIGYPCPPDHEFVKPWTIVE